MEVGHTTQLQNWLTVLDRDDVRAEIIEHTCERLRGLARRMLRGIPGVHRWTETDDVLQNALIRLHRSLAEVRPQSARQFYGLATTQIRRELLDLARSQFGPEGIGKNHQTDGGVAAAELATTEPQSLEDWTAFHEEVEKLPDQEREVFGLLWYGGLPQADAAKVLGISLATLKRRWQSARLHLGKVLHDQPS
jgi:RNA polymerase sigma factor (sigma-70 family)